MKKFSGISYGIKCWIKFKKNWIKFELILGNFWFITERILEKVWESLHIEDHAQYLHTWTVGLLKKSLVIDYCIDFRLLD